MCANAPKHHWAFACIIRRWNSQHHFCTALQWLFDSAIHYMSLGGWKIKYSKITSSTTRCYSPYLEFAKSFLFLENRLSNRFIVGVRRIAERCRRRSQHRHSIWKSVSWAAVRRHCHSEMSLINSKSMQWARKAKQEARNSKVKQEHNKTSRRNQMSGANNHQTDWRLYSSLKYHKSYYYYSCWWISISVWHPSTCSSASHPNNKNGLKQDIYSIGHDYKEFIYN